MADRDVKRASSTPVRGVAGPLAVRAARDLARLIIPVACPGCGRRDVKWCDECEAPWWEAPLRSESAAPRLDVEGAAALPVWAIAELAGSSHTMVGAWKDAGRRDLDRFFADAMTRAAMVISPALEGWGEVAVVPVPARAASTRRRGVDLPGLLAIAAAQGLAASGLPARAQPMLGIGRGEQRGASARERWRQASAIRVRATPQVQGIALLVDDVMTTGATIAAAARALDVTLLTAAAGLCLATAPPRGAAARGQVS